MYNRVPNNTLLLCFIACFIYIILIHIKLIIVLSHVKHLEVDPKRCANVFPSVRSKTRLIFLKGAKFRQTLPLHPPPPPPAFSLQKSHLKGRQSIS